MKVSNGGRPLPKIIVGHHEPIFDRLPANVSDNFRRPGSENALVWNLVYPFARPTISLRALLAVPPLWGSPGLRPADDPLTPYFWGYGVDGRPLAPLADALVAIDGKGPATEIDLILLGRENLVVVEAKHRSPLGRCSRYQHGACPQVHETDGEPCRYWAHGNARFEDALDFRQPEPDNRPDCHRHYQLARTLLVGSRLADQLGLRLHMWLICPRRHWRSLERDWVDFAGRVCDSEQWRRMRALAWEDLRSLSAGRRG
jgi:hypothetical protein